MTAREKLIEELKMLPAKGNTYASTYLLGSTLAHSRIEQIADFIIADRKNVILPLIAYKLSVIEVEQNFGLRKSDKAINETLTRAGVN